MREQDELIAMLIQMMFGVFMTKLTGKPSSRPYKMKTIIKTIICDENWARLMEVWKPLVETLEQEEQKKER